MVLYHWKDIHNVYLADSHVGLGVDLRSERKRALISTYDKEGVVDLAKELVELGYEIISTGGTFKALHEAQVPVTRISDVTGFPEILDGRVKTLHPLIHGGILATDDDEHIEALKENEIDAIDLVIVNLYPFEETIAKDDVGLDEVVENIDIGGPTMVRAAAKNFEHVAIVIEPSQYSLVLEELRSGGISLETRRRLAFEAFSRTAEYDAIISGYLRSEFLGEEAYPERFVLPFRKIQDLRYGENPYQKAAFYRDIQLPEPCIATANKVKGKELSFNNILDIDATIEMVKDFEEPAVAIVKHMNPSGIASADSISLAFELALGGDPLSAYGGIVALNRPLDSATAQLMRKIFLDSIIAPSFDEDALPILSKKKVMLLEMGSLTGVKKPGLDVKKVTGGMLVQSRDLSVLDTSVLKVVTERKPTDDEKRDMVFGWKVVKHVKSNAIVLVKGRASVGVGAGQMSRVGSVEIAAKKAGDSAYGSVMASDAFFPFRDGIDVAGKAGIKAVIHPGGSIRDQEVIDAANEYGMAMVFTGMRCLKH